MPNDPYSGRLVVDRARLVRLIQKAGESSHTATREYIAAVRKHPAIPHARLAEEAAYAEGVADVLNYLLHGDSPSGRLRTALQFPEV